MNLDFNIWHEEFIWGVKNLGQQNGNCSIFLGPCALCRRCKTWITQTQTQLLDISLLALHGQETPLFPFSWFHVWLFEIIKKCQILYFCACVPYAYRTCNHRCAFFSLRHACKAATFTLSPGWMHNMTLSKNYRGLLTFSLILHLGERHCHASFQWHTGWRSEENCWPDSGKNGKAVSPKAWA